MTRIHDLIGIGFGPNNIGLAVHLYERATPGSTLFLEARGAADWHGVAGGVAVVRCRRTRHRATVPDRRR